MKLTIDTNHDSLQDLKFASDLLKRLIAQKESASSSSYSTYDSESNTEFMPMGNIFQDDSTQSSLKKDEVRVNDINSLLENSTDDDDTPKIIFDY